MGTDSLEFGAGELVVVGGDYGTVILAGTTQEARGALDTLIGATRRCSERTRVVSLVVEHDDSPDLIENRHAGLEGTQRFDFVAVPVVVNDDT